MTLMRIFYNLQFVSLCSSVIQGLKLFTFTILSFHFLIMKKGTTAWQLYVLEWSNGLDIAKKCGGCALCIIWGYGPEDL